MVFDNWFFRISLVLFLLASASLIPRWWTFFFHNNVQTIRASGNNVAKLILSFNGILAKFHNHMQGVLNRPEYHDAYIILRERMPIIVIYFYALLYRVFPRSLVHIDIASHDRIYRPSYHASYHSDSEYSAARAKFSFYDFTMNLVAHHKFLLTVALCSAMSLYPLCRALKICFPLLWCVFVMYKRIFSWSFVNKLKIILSAIEFIRCVPSMADCRALARYSVEISFIWMSAFTLLLTYGSWKFMIMPIVKEAFPDWMDTTDMLIRIDPYSGQSSHAFGQLSETIRRLFKPDKRGDSQPTGDTPEMIEVTLPHLSMEQLTHTQCDTGTIIYPKYDNNFEADERLVTLYVDDICHMVHDMLDSEFKRTPEYYITHATNRFLVTTPRDLVDLTVYSMAICSLLLRKNIHFQTGQHPLESLETTKN